jgi:hypothetical protein
MIRLYGFISFEFNRVANQNMPIAANPPCKSSLMSLSHFLTFVPKRLYYWNSLFLGNQTETVELTGGLSGSIPDLAVTLLLKETALGNQSASVYRIIEINCSHLILNIFYQAPPDPGFLLFKM